MFDLILLLTEVETDWAVPFPLRQFYFRSFLRGRGTTVPVIWIGTTAKTPKTFRHTFTTSPPPNIDSVRGGIRALITVLTELTRSMRKRRWLLCQGNWLIENVLRTRDLCDSSYVNSCRRLYMDINVNCGRQRTSYWEMWKIKRRRFKRSALVRNCTFTFFLMERSLLWFLSIWCLQDEVILIFCPLFQMN